MTQTASYLVEVTPADLAVFRKFTVLEMLHNNGVCPTCGGDCNERDELIKAEKEIERLRERLRTLGESNATQSIPTSGTVLPDS